MSAAGYLRPHHQRALNSEDEASVLAVCSGLTLHQEAREGRENDRVWGPIVSVETGYATDAEVRFRGSSGGTTTAILLHLLETGKVDFVLHTRSSTDDPVGNVTLPSYTREDVLIGAGSRYAPSAPLEKIEQYLQTGKRFAFVGKPCDVASLRKMALYDPRIDQQIPLLLSFFCAGVPSRHGALAVLRELGVSEQELASFDYRGRGWPGLARAVRRDGTEASMDYHSSWGTILNKHLQFRCKICPEGIGEFADVACADAWYGKDGYPDFAEREGRSLVIARTGKGRQLLDDMTARGSISLEPLALSEIALMQPYQADRRRAIVPRLAALLARGRRLPSYRGFALWDLAIKSSPVWLLRNFVGTFRRAAKGKPLS